MSKRIDLKSSTHLEVLSLSRCTKSILQSSDCLAMINQISSDRFRLLNISFMGEAKILNDVLVSYRTHFAAIDKHLQLANFVNLEYLTLGVSNDSINSIEDYFPLTAMRGLVRVVTVEEMEDLPAMKDTKDTGIQYW